MLVTDLNAEEQTRVAEINAKMASQGLYHSGARIKAVGDIRADKIRRLIDGRIKIPRELLPDVPELGFEESISDLLLQMESMIANALAGFHDSIQAGGPAAHQGARLDDQNRRLLEAHATREIEMVKKEVELKFHVKKPEATGAISVYAPGGAAMVNVGQIYGHVQQVIGKVGDEGHAELANLLEQLASAISKTEDLSNDRVAYLEQVEFIAEQASVPPELRKASLVAGMFRGLQSGLQNVANLAQLVALLGPALAQHFGFPWPL